MPFCGSGKGYPNELDEPFRHWILTLHLTGCFHARLPSARPCNACYNSRASLILMHLPQNDTVPSHDSPTRTLSDNGVLCHTATAQLPQTECLGLYPQNDLASQDDHRIPRRFPLSGGSRANLPETTSVSGTAP
jgi:hypothetical protein